MVKMSMSEGDQTVNRLIDNVQVLNLKGDEKSFRLLILYAGETGNSEDLAKRIGWQALGKGLEIVAKQFDDYQIENLVNEQHVLFICSTTNQGDEPACLLPFWRFIMRRGLPVDVLSDLNCAVIGLGDSSYLKYNVVGKKLFKRLKQLGARMILDVCLGDDQHDLGLDAAVDRWLPDFWNEIDKNSNDKHHNLNTSQENLFKLYDVQLIDSYSLDKKIEPDDSNLKVNYNQNNYHLSTVISNVRVTSDDHFQETRLVKLGLTTDNSSLNYSPGDVVMVLPSNLKENVNEFIRILNLDPNQLVRIKKINRNFLSSNLYDTIENQPISIRKLVERYFDLSSVPKRSFFEVLSTYSTDQLESDKLKEFSSTNGQYALYEYCKRPKRNVLEVLIDFPKTTSNLNIDLLFQLINPIFPRPYSIASSLSVTPNQLHILCAVKKQRTLLKKIRLGLCSNYLKDLKEGDQVSIYIKKGTLELPKDEIPLIMIGPGTGIAPFRSIIQDRTSRGVSSNHLFFGCRSRKKDFYFEDEWSKLADFGMLNYYVAFSRDQANKVYVQDKMWDNRQLIWDLLSKEDARIIVCGSSSQMPKDVREMLIRILNDQAKFEDENKADSIVDKFEMIKKLQFECWD